MSLCKKIYFSPFGFLVTLVQKMLKPFVSQMMVYGCYNRVQKKFCRNTRISSSAFITGGANLDIGDNVWINHYARIDASGGVKIGDGCQIGYAAMILSHSTHVAIRLNGAAFIKKDIPDRVGYILKPVEIGEYTFIGGGSAVLPGVKIGKGCVVGVNSVVTKDVPDYTIVAGNPARILGSTIETDKKFFDNPIVRECYYDQSLIEKEQSCAVTKE